MAVYSINDLDLWNRNVADFQKDQEHKHLTDRLQLEDGKGVLPEADKIVAFWRKEGAFNLNTPERQTAMKTLCIRLSLLYRDHPKDCKVFQWVRDSVSLINDKEAYPEKLKKIIVVFSIVKKFYKVEKEKNDIFWKGIKVGIKLENNGIKVKKRDDYKIFSVSSSTSTPISTKEVSFFVSMIGQLKKKNQLAQYCSEKNATLFSHAAITSCVPFIKKHRLSKDLTIRSLAERMLLEYDYQEASFEMGSLKYPQTLLKQLQILEIFQKETQEYYPHCQTTLNKVRAFDNLFRNCNNFQDYDDDAKRALKEITDDLEELGKEIKMYSNLYDFFLSEMIKTVPKKNDQPAFRLDGKVVDSLSSHEYFSTTPTCSKPLAFEQEEKSLDEFVPEHLKKPPPKNKNRVLKPSKQQPKEKEPADITPEEDLHIQTTHPNWRAQVRIFKGPMKFRYAEHVTRWISAPEKVLQTDEYVNQHPKAKGWSLFAHTFPLFIDEFVGTPYSYQTTYHNPRTKSKDTLYSIPAEVSTSTEVVRGLYQYAIDRQTGVCYHRCFRREHPDSFIQALLEEKVWNHIDFPSIDEGIEFSKVKPMAFNEHSYQFTYERTFGSISFEQEGAQVTLFRLEMLN